MLQLIFIQWLPQHSSNNTIVSDLRQVTYFPVPCFLIYEMGIISTYLAHKGCNELVSNYI